MVSQIAIPLSNILNNKRCFALFGSVSTGLTHDLVSITTNNSYISLVYTGLIINTKTLIKHAIVRMTVDLQVNAF